MYENFPAWYEPQKEYDRLSDMEQEALRILERTEDHKLFKKGQRILNSLAETKKQIKDMMIKYG